MRTVTFKGNVYPIRATVTVEQRVTKRFTDFVAEAERTATEQAEKNGLDEEQVLEQVQAARKAASKEYLQNIENTLWQFAELINAAVEYSSIILGKDISNDIVGGYPMTEKKLAFLVSVEDLNRDETVEAVAEEFAEERGGTLKNGQAGELVKKARKMATQI